MPLVNMKRAEVEKKGTLLGAVPEATDDDYTWGLRINLEEPELQKLGLEDPKVGGKIPLVVIAKVVSYSEEEKGRSLTLLLTDIGVASKEEEPKPDRTKVMYEKE